MVAFRDNDLFGIPWPLIYLLAVFALFQFLLHHSRFGQHLQAVGGNRDMAQMSGLNVRRLTIIVWLLAGIAAGLAILPLLSQGSGSSSGTATPLLLETVLATFIGAAFSRRRVVTIWGALLGAVLVNALSNGLGLLGVNIFWMGAIKGGLILVVLAASAVRHKEASNEPTDAQDPLNGANRQRSAGVAIAGRIRRHYPAGDCPVRLGEPGISDRR